MLKMSNMGGISRDGSSPGCLKARPVNISECGQRVRQRKPLNARLRALIGAFSPPSISLPLYLSLYLSIYLHMTVSIVGVPASLLASILTPLSLYLRVYLSIYFYLHI